MSGETENKRQILVTRSSMPPMDEYFKEIESLWDTHWLTNSGEKHQRFEAALRERMDVPNVAVYVNGHSALEGVLEAMELGKDGKKKVITTPFSFASTTHAIVRAGLIPVFADIKESDYTLDPAAVEDLIDEETCAILPVHVYGNLCDVDAFQSLGERYGLKVIYDAAHAFSVKRNGVDAGSFGDASMFSFHATKVFNSIEGGAVVFKDSDLGVVLNQWKNFGITGPESVEYVGGNAKMNEFCAAMGICNLRHLDLEIQKRKCVAERYFSQLGDVPGLKLCLPKDGVQSNYAYLPVVFDDDFGATRDEVFQALAADGVGARKYFYPLISDFDCYADQYDSSSTPVAAYVASHVLTLPMYADLGLEDVNRICNIVRSCA